MHAIKYFSRTPPVRSPPELRHLNGQTRIEISTIHRSARKTGSSELWRNIHVKIRSAAFGSNNRAREFNDPNFGFSESCTKKNALNKVARMSRVRHNAKSIENRYNSFQIFTKLFETFCPPTKHAAKSIA